MPIYGDLKMNKEEVKKFKETQALVRKEYNDYFENIQKLNQELLNNIKAKLPELEKLLEEVNGEWCYCDMVYRFYHNSFKVFWVQDCSVKIFNILKELDPKKETKFDDYFVEIYNEGTGKEFKSIYNKNWTKHTRVLLECFFHCKYMLEMAVKCGKEIDTAPTLLPSGWAGLLSLYNLR
jgi:hypothetical protein